LSWSAFVFGSIATEITGSGNTIDSRSRVRGLQPDGRRDVAGVRHLDLLALVRVHLEESPDPLLLPRGRVQQVLPALQGSRIDPEVRELPHVGIGRDLERQSRYRLGVVRLAQDLAGALGPHLVPLDRENVRRRREVVDHPVQEALNALVLERRAAEDRDDREIHRGRADDLLELLHGDLVAVEVALHEIVAVVGHRLHELRPGVAGGVHEVSRDVHLVEGHPVAFLVVHVRAHREEIDDAVEQLPLAHGQIEGNRLRTEAVAHGLDHRPVVRAHAVHLVHEGDPRNAVLVRLPPHGLRLRLHATDRAEHRDGAVQDPEAALHLHREVHVAGRVDDVDLVLFPVRRDRGRGYRDPAFLLLRHPVHRGRAVVDLAHPMQAPRVVQDALGGRGLPGIDVGHDADVPDPVQRVAARHDFTIPRVDREYPRPDGLDRKRGFPPLS
jgi:hypothetical protein